MTAISYTRELVINHRVRLRVNQERRLVSRSVVDFLFRKRMVVSFLQLLFIRMKSSQIEVSRKNLRGLINFYDVSKRKKKKNYYLLPTNRTY